MPRTLESGSVVAISSQISANSLAAYAPTERYNFNGCLANNRIAISHLPLGSVPTGNHCISNGTNSPVPNIRMDSRGLSYRIVGAQYSITPKTEQVAVSTQSIMSSDAENRTSCDGPDYYTSGSTSTQSKVGSHNHADRATAEPRPIQRIPTVLPISCSHLSLHNRLFGEMSDRNAQSLTCPDPGLRTSTAYGAITVR